MRKTSQKFNSDIVDVIHELVRRLLRSRAFEDAGVRGKYWQVIIDGTQVYSRRKELDEKSLSRVHNRGTEKEYTEYYYYVLETKLVLQPGIIVSIMTEFVENTDDGEAKKQDCGRKACYHLMERLKKESPRLPICLNVDSLYACENFFAKCQRNGWHYILSFKDGSIPTVAGEFGKIREIEGNRQEQKLSDGVCWHDFVTGIGYNGHGINIVEYGGRRCVEIKKGLGRGNRKDVRVKFVYITDLPVNKKTWRHWQGREGGAGKLKMGGSIHKKARALPGTFIQQGLPGNEKPLFPNTNWTYDIPGDGDMGETLGEGRAGHRGGACADTGIIPEHKAL